MNGGRPRRSSREIEALPLAVEVLVELSAGRSDDLRRAKDARSGDPREAVELRVRLRPERDGGQALPGRGHEERPYGRVDDVEAHVDEVEGHRGVAETAVEVG